MQKEDNDLILDVRTPEEFAEGHIPHAINIPMDAFGDEAPRTDCCMEQTCSSSIFVQKNSSRSVQTPGTA